MAYSCVGWAVRVLLNGQDKELHPMYFVGSGGKKGVMWWDGQGKGPHRAQHDSVGGGEEGVLLQ
jgi:hypothetical protein